VTYADALRYSTNPDDFALYFRGVSQSTDVDWTKTKRVAPTAPPGTARRPSAPPPPQKPQAADSNAAPGEAEGWLERHEK